MFIINFKTGKTEFYKLDTEIYKSILSSRFGSTSDDDYKCYIVCKNFHEKQLKLFDINDHKNVKTLTIQNYGCDHEKVQISYDFKQVAYSNEHENLVFEDKGDY